MPSRAICGRPADHAPRQPHGEPATADPGEVEARSAIASICSSTREDSRRLVDVDVTGADPVAQAGAISWDDIRAWLDTALAIRPAR
jgi:hypothetical protein